MDTYLLTSSFARFVTVVTVAAIAACVAGCATSSSGGIADSTLEMFGLRKPEVPDEAKAALTPQPKKISLRIHAGDQLNTDPQKRSLSIVVRIYKLRSANSFLAAPYKSFGTSDSEKPAFGGDLLDVRELVLTPGQKYEVLETMPLDAHHIGVVALFRAPSEGRWRFAFDSKQAEKTGITVGVHGCAMSVAAGAPEGAPPETLRLAGVACL